MAFPQLPADAVGTPIGASYVPNDQFYAIQASQRKKTDTISNVYTAPVFELRTQEDVRQGLMYIATTGKRATATNPSLIMGASLFNPAAGGKTIVVLSVRVMQNVSQGDVHLNLTTTDPAYASTLTPQNMSAGWVATSSTASITCAADGAIASITAGGTVIDNTMLAANVAVEFIPYGMGILLPAGAANGLAAYQTVLTAGSLWAISFRYVEY